MTVESSPERIDASLARLRAEVALASDATRQAILHHEIGVLEAARGDEPAAEQAYRAAADADGGFREPLEALLASMARRGGDVGMAALHERLVDTASDTEETTRALFDLAAYRADVDNDSARARACLEQAVELDPTDAAAWLALELAAARDGDRAARARALAARAGLASDGTVQATLLMALAELRVALGAPEVAAALLEQAVGLEGRARYLARLAQERIAVRTSDEQGAASALEGQAELITACLAAPDFAAATGVPRPLRTPAHAAAAWLRAADARRRLGDEAGAADSLAAARERMPDSPLVARLHIAGCDAVGDAEGAVACARAQVAVGVSGAVGAAMWVRIAIAEEALGDAEAAIAAYTRALELDPRSVVAETRRLSLLAGDGGERLARALEEKAARGDDAARARAWLSAALVWALRARRLAEAKHALERAAQLGADAVALARIDRMLSGALGDDAGYEAATLRLIEAREVGDGERAALAVELGRVCLEHGDAPRAIASFARLAACDGATGWLGRALVAYADGSASKERAARVHELAKGEADIALGRGLVTVAAWLGARCGEVQLATAWLAREHEHAPEDVIVALLLAELRERSDGGRAAAAVLSACATAVSEPAMAAALELEAGLRLWRAEDRVAAIAAMERAHVRAPEAAGPLLAWALRCSGVDDRATRARIAALGRRTASGRILSELEQLGLALVERDGELDPAAVLGRLAATDPDGEIGDAAALGELLFAANAPASPELETALARLESHGGSARAVALAERFRRARFVERDPGLALAAARAWAREQESVAAALAWLSAAREFGDATDELAARRLLAEVVDEAERPALRAWAAGMAVVTGASRGEEPIVSADPAARLANLELAPPGCATNRRALALRGLGDALGQAANADAARLAAWSDLAAGRNDAAKEAFLAVAEEAPGELAAWEGLRAAAAATDDWPLLAKASLCIAGQVRDDARAAEAWENAGVILLERLARGDEAEAAFARALERDPRRAIAFDRLFRRVRGRNDDELLLGLIARRLDVAEDEAELTKLYWERARVLRKRGDKEAALAALNDVTMLEPDHVGALALAAEIRINGGEFAEAAPLLSRLAVLTDAPAQQRLMSAMAAVDLYEKKLGQPELALEVLQLVHKDGLSTVKVRERLARAAARLGRWEQAASVLEQLMEEREQASGRIDAARLAMAIYRDKLDKPKRAEKAVARLLREAPDDTEALGLVLRTELDLAQKKQWLHVGRQRLLAQLGTSPFDAPRLVLLAEILAWGSELDRHRAVLGVLEALGDEDRERRSVASRLDARSSQKPAVVLDRAEILAIGDPDDTGPLAALLSAIAGLVSEALGPSLKSDGVGRRERVDAGAQLRVEVSRWMGALGFADFELYVGGRDPRAVVGVAGELPALVVGQDVRAPLTAPMRAAIAREAFGLRRGTSLVLRFDEDTVAAIVAAVSLDVGVAVPEPRLAVYTEVERAVKRAMPRKLRKVAADLCAAVRASEPDVAAWIAAARRSLDRMTVVATGDAAAALDDVAGPKGSAARATLETNERARALLSFALSGELVALRQRLGMGAK